MRRRGSFIVIILLAVSLLQGNTPQNLPIENRTVVWEESVPVSLLVSPTATPLSAPGPDIRPIAAESVMAKYTPEPVPTPYGPISDIPPSTPSPGGAVTQSAQLRQKEASFDQNNGYVSTEKGLKVPILMYHNLFEGNKKGDGLNVSEKTFEDQLATLAAFGYSTITFEELYRHYNENVALPKNPVIITFDDGYRSSYTLAFPLLKSYGMKACIFMICDAIGSSNFMTKTQLKELSDSGLIEIQSHSVSHDYQLMSMENTAMAQELVTSKSRLEEITGKTVTVFCYPYGRYSKSLIEEVKKQGYLFSVTTQYGCASKKNNPLSLPRIRVSGEDTGKALRKKIEALTGRVTTPLPTLEPTPSPSETLPPQPEASPSLPEASPSAPESSPPSSPEASPSPSEAPSPPVVSPSPPEASPSALNAT